MVLTKVKPWFKLYLERKDRKNEKRTKCNHYSRGGGSPEPVASASLGLRLALNATARACNQERGLACRALDSAQGKPCSVALLGLAFTMAEILLSLTIIGVVAAITLPSLTGNINERTWNTQRKALYARFSQAMSLMPSLNGYGTFREVTDSDTGSTSMEDTAAETFITAGLSKVLKINNICDSEHLKDCGLPDKIIPYSGSVITPFPDTMLTLNPAMQEGSTNGSANVPDTKVAAFETANGESVAVYYNPRCVQLVDYGATWASAHFNRVCANFIYDLNGTKGPNAYGKDIGFITAFNPTDSTVAAPYVLPGIGGHGTYKEASSRCKTLDENSRVPTDYEMSAMTVNKKLIGYVGLNYPYWVSDIVNISSDGSKSRFVQYWTDNIDSRWEWAETDNGTSLCVRRD